MHQLAMGAPDLELSCGDALCSPLNCVMPGVGHEAGGEDRPSGFGECFCGALGSFKSKQASVLDADQSVQEAILVQVCEGRGRAEAWLEVQDVVVNLDQIGVPIAREEPEVLNAAHFVGHEDPRPSSVSVKAERNTR